MSFSRSRFLLILAFLFAAFLFLFTGSVINTESGTRAIPGEYNSGYAELSVDESVNDRELRAVLDSAIFNGKMFFGGPSVSESSQWVLLDEFDSLAMIPLDEYSLRVHSFDPRNDGYAEKIKNIFVRDGKRFFYIPFKNGKINNSMMEKQLKSLMGDIPFTVNFYGIGKPLRFLFILFSAASIIMIIICCIRKNSHPGKVGKAGLVLLPGILSSFVFFEAPGIAAAALMFGIFVILREPLNEINTILGLQITKAQRRKAIKRDVLERYIFYWVCLPLLLAALGIIVAFSRITLWFTFAVLSGSCLLFLLSVRIFSSSGGIHRRFSPVTILKHIAPDFGFSVYMIPYILASFIALFFTHSASKSIQSGPVILNTNNVIKIIKEEDYLAHLDFQSNFSMRQLDTSGSAYPSEHRGAVPDYIMGQDGLPELNASGISAFRTKFDDFPPFPQKHLMDFLSSAYTGTRMGPQKNEWITPENVSLLVLLVFMIPAFFPRQGIHFPQKIRQSGYKYFNKKRQADIDRKMIMFYNKINKLMVRKDA